MKGLTSVRLSAGIVVLVLSGSALPGTATPAQGTPSGVATRNVIVILRDQRPDVPAVRGVRAARAAALAASQGPIVSHLQGSRATRIRNFALINAVAATVSEAEAQQLAAHPLVQAVVPEATIKLQRRSELNLARTTTSSSNGSRLAAAGAAEAGGASGLCNTLEPEALQLLHAASLNSSTPQAQNVIDGNGQRVTGKGVKVAFIADGLDPTVPGFVRPDGSSVFIDYQDFSGDPAGTPTSGAEAFGDASSIAAQDMPSGTPLLYDISQFVDTALGTLPSSPCNIRIRGMAPGASLVGLKVFSALAITTNTALVQAIEYAVVHDDVDVINESFGGNPFPDTLDDPVSLANRAAVEGGVTVVVSTGDAGTNGTLGSSSTDPWVIAAGASTQLRLYTQIGYGASYFATRGWLSNNISALSSGGFSQSGPRVPDVVAPGDLGWALCSTNPALYFGCGFSFGAGAPPPIELFGGTSESSPLTAGTAALVIQAYRSTHHGADPTPALVKQIIMSTATDLGAPPSEQGAGLVNALAAVNAALSVADQNGQPKGTGASVLNNPTSASIVDHPNASETVSVAVTNTGSATQHLQPALQALGAPIAGATVTVQLDPTTAPIFPSQAGFPRGYVLQHFHVPEGAQHLDAAIAWQAPFTNAPVTANFGLIDPSGRDAAYSLPQGAGQAYGHVDVVNPAAGTWTAVIWTSDVTQTYTGPVQFSWSAERYVQFGSVSPTSLDLAPGATSWITARFTMPAQPGDQGVAIRFGRSEEGGVSHSDIPIALRTLIPIGPEGGSFGGTLTGGNGRGGAGPTQTFAFDVPHGINNMSLALQVSDSLYLLEGLLIDPNGMQRSVGLNVDVFGNTATAMQLNRANPTPGRWRFILLVDFFTSGNQTTLPFTAQISLNTAQVTAAGMPNDPEIKLSASSAPVAVPITITNNSGLAQEYFADARLGGLTSLPFGAFPVCGVTLPGGCWSVILPTQVHSVQFVAQSTAPITMDAYNIAGFFVGGTGAPDLTARPIGPNTVEASLTEPEVPWGVWQMFPTLVGPFGPAGAPTTSVTTSVQAKLAPFDAAVTADSGDLWSDVTFGTNTANPLVLAPGQSGVIHVTITPDPTKVGTTVRGSLYIDTFNGTAQYGDEVYRIPYSYTISP
jgi:hypothetical protein